MLRPHVTEVYRGIDIYEFAVIRPGGSTYEFVAEITRYATDEEIEAAVKAGIQRNDPSIQTVNERLQESDSKRESALLQIQQRIDRMISSHDLIT